MGEYNKNEDQGQAGQQQQGEKPAFDQFNKGQQQQGQQDSGKQQMGGEGANANQQQQDAGKPEAAAGEKQQGDNEFRGDKGQDDYQK